MFVIKNVTEFGVVRYATGNVLKCGIENAHKFDNRERAEKSMKRVASLHRGLSGKL